VVQLTLRTYYRGCEINSGRPAMIQSGDICVIVGVQRAATNVCRNKTFIMLWRNVLVHVDYGPDSMYHDHWTVL